MNFATTKQRILQYIDFKGVSVSKFLQETGIKRGFLDTDKLESSVSDIFLTMIIAKFPDLNLYWLITGKGEMECANQYEGPEPNFIVAEPESPVDNMWKDLALTQKEMLAIQRERINELQSKIEKLSGNGQRAS